MQGSDLSVGQSNQGRTKVRWRAGTRSRAYEAHPLRDTKPAWTDEVGAHPVEPTAFAVPAAYGVAIRDDGGAATFRQLRGGGRRRRSNFRGCRRLLRRDGDRRGRRARPGTRWPGSAKAELRCLFATGFDQGQFRFLVLGRLQAAQGRRTSRRFQRIKLLHFCSPRKDASQDGEDDRKRPRVRVLHPLLDGGRFQAFSAEGANPWG